MSFTTFQMFHAVEVFITLVILAIFLNYSFFKLLIFWCFSYRVNTNCYRCSISLGLWIILLEAYTIDAEILYQLLFYSSAWWCLNIVYTNISFTQVMMQWVIQMAIRPGTSDTFPVCTKLIIEARIFQYLVVPACVYALKSGLVNQRLKFTFY